MRVNWATVADRLYRLIRDHPYKIVVASLCLAALSFQYTRGHLEFWTERNVLISQKSRSAMLYREYRKEFKDDYVILVLRSKDLEQAISEIQRCAGAQFDPHLVPAFVEVLRETSQEEAAIPSLKVIEA